MDNSTPVLPAPQDEIWCDIPDYEGVYEVSNLGRVRRIKTGRILKPSTSSGYFGVLLCINGVQTYNKIHTLVMKAFVGTRPNGYHTNHKNGIKKDNRLDNLEYVTPAENIAHAFRTGLIYTNISPDDASELVLKTFKSFENRPSITELSDMTGVSYSRVIAILKAKCYLYSDHEPVVEDKHYRRFSDAARKEALEMLDKGIKQRDIATKFNVHECQITRLKQSRRLNTETVL